MHISILLVIILIAVSFFINYYYIKHEGVKEENFLISSFISSFGAIIIFSNGLGWLNIGSTMLSHFVFSLLIYSGTKAIYRTLHHIKGIDSEEYTKYNKNITNHFQWFFFSMIILYIISFQFKIMFFMLFVNLLLFLINIAIIYLSYRVLKSIGLFNNLIFITNPMILALFFNLSSVIHLFYYTINIKNYMKYPEAVIIYKNPLFEMDIVIIFIIVLIFIIPKILHVKTK